MSVYKEAAIELIKLTYESHGIPYDEAAIEREYDRVLEEELKRIEIENKKEQK